MYSRLVEGAIAYMFHICEEYRVRGKDCIPFVGSVPSSWKFSCDICYQIR